MEVIKVNVDKNVDNSRNYTHAVHLLNNGEVVAFPTETVYGLGAVATNDAAVKKIFSAKGRPSDNPLIVHIGTVEELTTYIEDMPAVAKLCMDAFWPGPLTLVMNAKPNVLAPSVTAGLQTVGMRMPDHPVALGLLRAIKKPIAAPSANLSGKPSPTRAQHVAEDLADRIQCVLDGGATGIGLESTVLDVTLTPPVILRPGGITKEMLEEVIGPVLAPDLEEQKIESTPKAPGMKYTHYAPEAPVYLIDADAKKITRALEQLRAEGHRIALLAKQSFATCPADYFFTFGADKGLQTEQMAATLYDALRACDKTDATIILATATEKQGVGVAVMNRLEKAAAGQWYKAL